MTWNLQRWKAFVWYHTQPDRCSHNPPNRSVVLVLTGPPIAFLTSFHVLAAGLSGLAFLFGLVEVLPHYSGPAFGSFFSGLAFTLTLIVWIIDLVLWGIVKNVLKDNGISAGYGNANWLTLGALIVLSGDSVGCGISCCCIHLSYRTTEYHHTQTFNSFHTYTREVYY